MYGHNFDLMNTKKQIKTKLKVQTRKKQVKEKNPEQIFSLVRLFQERQQIHSTEQTIQT